MRYINLNIDTLKIFGTQFSYNYEIQFNYEKLKEEKDFYKFLRDMEQVLKTRKMRNLTLEGKFFFFFRKTLATSTIVF